MQYDDELAKSAQEHINKCEFCHDEPGARRSSRFAVGQNMMWACNAGEDWEKAVENFYMEVKKLPYSAVDRYKTVGHEIKLCCNPNLEQLC